MAGAVAFITALGLPGQALAQPAAGQEHFTIVETFPPHSARVTASGVFAAAGRDVDNPDGTSTFIFPTGTITVKPTGVPGGTFVPKPNPTSCVARIAATGDFTITGGTGAFQGVAGNGEFAVNGTFVFAHAAAGCSPGPVAAVILTRGVGQVGPAPSTPNAE